MKFGTIGAGTVALAFAREALAKACGRLDRGRGRAVPKIGNLAGKRFWTSSAAQHYLMTSRQGLPRERKRDRAGAYRSELHGVAY